MSFRGSGPCASEGAQRTTKQSATRQSTTKQSTTGQSAHSRFQLGQIRLFWRVYLHGLLMLVSIGLGVSLLSIPFRGESWWGSLPTRLTSWAERAGRGDGEPGPGLARAFAQLDGLVPLELTARDIQGTPVFTSVDPPLPEVIGIQEQLSARPVIDLHGPGWSFVVPLRHQGQVAGALYFRLNGTSPFTSARNIATFASIFVILGLISIPLVRSIVSPIERLTAQVRAFGTGDLTARSGIRRADEAGALAEAFDDMAERIERQMRSERELLANISHELRTPLARMRIAIEMADDKNYEESARYMVEIRSDINELQKLVEDILDSSRLAFAQAPHAASSLPLQREILQPELIVNAAAQRFQQLWPDRTLQVTLAPDLPLIQADLTLLRRALDNLLDNARKYADTAAPISLSLRHSADSKRGLLIDIEDQGEGIPQEALPLLFDPFYRVDGSRQRSSGGVGLGLTLVKRIVEAHQGTVTVESQLKKGSLFQIWLPEYDEEAAPEALS